MIRQTVRVATRSTCFVVALAGAIAYTGAASATAWLPGDEITYSQQAWVTGSGPTLLNADFANLYPSGVAIGGNFNLTFTTAAAVLAFLPQVGDAKVLTGNELDPTSSSSGLFGGDLLALKLNIDFADAGFTLGASGIPFGNLLLENLSTLPNLNGLTVRQFQDDANLCLGGGPCIDSVDDLDTIAAELDNSFVGSNVTDFAQANLVAPGTVSVPEPLTLSLFGAGLIGAAAMRRRRKSKAV